MNYLRNFFGWNVQKNNNNPQPNKVEKEVDGFVAIDSHINEPETNFISKEFNIRNASNNIISGVKKITSGVLDIVSYANPFNNELVNNKTQQKAGMLSDIKNIQDLTEKVKLYFGIDNAYLKNKKDHLNVKNLMNLMKENQGLWTKIEKLESSKPKSRFESYLNEKKVSAILFLMSKNNAEILHNYICLACAKASSDDGSDKQQMQYLFQANDVAEKIAKKYEIFFEKITSKISELENLLEKRKNLEKKRNELKTKRGLNQNANKGNLNKKISGKKDAILKRPGVSNKRKNISTPKLPKEIVDNYDKPHALKNYINSKPFKNESTEESSVLDDFDTDIDSIKDGYNKTKAKYDKQNKLMNEQKKELSKLRKEQDKINNVFAQYAQNDVSNEEIDKELEELERELEKSEK